MSRPKKDQEQDQDQDAGQDQYGGGTYEGSSESDGTSSTSSTEASQNKQSAETTAAPPKGEDLKAPVVEVVDMQANPNPEAFKPENPDAVVIAKSHPANPSTIATANVMRAQGKAVDNDDAKTVDLASESDSEEGKEAA